MAYATITNPGFTFSESLRTRTSTKKLILHHAASETLTAEGCHAVHKNKGWAGIGYNFYIHKNGTIYQGRGWPYVGAHALDNNEDSLGICCQGNYETNPTIPNAQRRALVELIADAWARYNFTSTGGHKNYTATECPGQYFPYTHFINCGKIYPQVRTAANKLGSQGIVNTPSYWYENFHQLNSLGELIIKLANAPKISGRNSFTHVIDALNHLAIKRVIDTPTYWLSNYSKVQYLGELLINVANKV